MIEIRRIWRLAGEDDVLHLQLTAEESQRDIKLRRSDNPAMYDFLEEHAATPVDTRADSDPKTRLS